jgi:hypothetical protein
MSPVDLIYKLPEPILKVIDKFASRTMKLIEEVGKLSSTTIPSGPLQGMKVMDFFRLVLPVIDMTMQTELSRYMPIESKLNRYANQTQSKNTVAMTFLYWTL